MLFRSAKAPAEKAAAKGATAKAAEPAAKAAAGAKGAAAKAAAKAAEPAACHTVRFADVGWTDITATTALTSRILEGLGYKTRTDVLAVPVTYASMKNKDIDIFLDNWIPSQSAESKPYLDDGSVVQIRANLEGAGYGPVVPQYVADAGVKDLKDLGKNTDKFEGKFYGIEPGITELDLEDDSRGPQLEERFARAAQSAIQDGADLLIPAEGFLNVFLSKRGIRRCGTVPVLDSFGALLAHAEMMTNLARRTDLKAGPASDERRRWIAHVATACATALSGFAASSR